MISNPKVGQKVRVWYRASNQLLPWHNHVGRVIVAGTGTPRNHLVCIPIRNCIDEMVVVPAGNLQPGNRKMSPPKTFLGLPKKQAETFEQIAINNDAGHHPATLKILIKKGLITKSFERMASYGLPAMNISRYVVPLNIHMAWCDWCASLPDEVLMEKDHAFF